MFAHVRLPQSLGSTGFWRPALGIGAFAREDRAPLTSSALWCHQAECVPHAGTSVFWASSQEQGLGRSR